MKDKLYLYSNTLFKNLFKDLFFDFEILFLSEENFNDENFKNNKVVFLINDNLKANINKYFFLYNSVLIFSSKEEKSIFIKEHERVKFFYGPIHVAKFVDHVKSSFVSNKIFFKDIEILGEQIINPSIKSSCFLTILEKKILTEFIEKKQIRREQFLENILKIKKNIETKTVESHLTRIRKKLQIIKSEIQISSKGDVFFIDD